MKNRPEEMPRESFRNPRSERHWRNKQRELEKRRRHEPVGRVIWEEEDTI